MMMPFAKSKWIHQMASGTMDVYYKDMEVRILCVFCTKKLLLIVKYQS